MRTLLVDAPLTAGQVIISGDEAHHGRSVLRLRPGEMIRLADGAGRTATARVERVDRHDIVAVAEDAVIQERPAAMLLTVACAIPKGDRFTDLVRQLTELGVGTILPLMCDRGERHATSLDRAKRVAGEALKQCRRSYVPTIGPVVDIPTLATRGEPLIILDPHGAVAKPQPPAPVTLVIGPEGGLTDDEISVLRVAGAEPVRLCATILRIETAAAAAAAVWISSWEAYRHD